MDSELQLLINNFAMDVESAERNFALAEEYERLNNASSALTHYLRAAERTQNDLLAYEALIRSANCLGFQKDRDFTQSHLLKQAICVLPHRPEAYFYLCKFYEESNQKYDCYAMASIALSRCAFGWTFFDESYGYMGKEGIEFLKAVSGVYWEKNDECIEILERLSVESEYQKIRELSKFNLDFVRSIQ